MQLLRDVRSVTTRLSLLEVLYLSIFLDASHLRNAPREMNPPHNRTEYVLQEHQFMAALSHTTVHHKLASSIRYLFPPALIGGLLDMIADCLQDIKSSCIGVNGKTLHAGDVTHRLDTLSHLVHEARTRFELVAVTPDSSTEINAFMAHMTASPATLLTTSMRAGDRTLQCERIIQFFSLNDHPLSQEARLAQRLADFETTVQADPSGNIMSAFGI